MRHGDEHVGGSALPVGVFVGRSANSSRASSAFDFHAIGHDQIQPVFHAGERESPALSVSPESTAADSLAPFAAMSPASVLATSRYTCASYPVTFDQSIGYAVESVNGATGSKFAPDETCPTLYRRKVAPGMAKSPGSQRLQNRKRLPH